MKSQQNLIYFLLNMLFKKYYLKFTYANICKSYYFLLFTFITFFYIQPIEYVYPVASMDQDNILLLIQQNAADNITLWFWDVQSKQLRSGLCSRFNPAGLCMLPDKSGFSFVDNGLVKIKFFHKRSPKTIALDEPLYNINLIQWIDSHCCYVSAKKHNHYSIFQLTTEGDVCCLVYNPSGDCLYPQKIDNVLFYIERIKNNYRMMCIPYPKILLHDIDNFNSVSDFDIQVQKILDKQIKKETMEEVNNQQLIFDFKKQPIAFLHMISLTEGFLLEYDAYIDTKDDTILFSYLHLTKNGNTWQHNQLFSFGIPAALLLADSPARLYESILPLLPRHINNAIYFVNVYKCNLNIFRYDLDSGIVEQKTFVKIKNQHCFTPFVVKDELCFGGTFVLK